MATRGRPEFPPGYGLLVEQAIEARGLSQSEVASRCGVSGPSVLRLRQGKGSWDTLIKVASFLEIPVPVMVMPTSDAAKLARLSRRSPVKYRLILSLLDEKKRTD